MMRSAPLIRKAPLRASKPLARSAISRPPGGRPSDRKNSFQINGVSDSRECERAPSRPPRARRKKRPGHDPAYLAACRGEACYLQLPGCRSYAGDETVVPAHQNMGKGMGLKAPDRYTVPACYHCHSLYDQSGMDREHKRAAWDWAYTRWVQARAIKMGGGGHA